MVVHFPASHVHFAGGSFFGHPGRLDARGFGGVFSGDPNGHQNGGPETEVAS